MKKSILIPICLISQFFFAQAVSNLNENSPKELKAFEFTLGKWEFNWYHMDPKTREIIDDGVAYSNVYLIQDGLTYADDFYKKNKDGSVVQGTTFRGYDPKAKKLRMCWIMAGSFQPTFMEGNVEGDEVVLLIKGEQNDQFGKYRVRIVFYDITKDSYKWRRDFVFDNGFVVEKTTFYEAKRIKD